MATIPILNLPIAIGLDGSEWVPLVQGTGSNAVTLRSQVSTITGTTGGFIPDTVLLNTNQGIQGGGLLASGLTLSLDLNALALETDMTVDDSFAIVRASEGNASRRVTFPDAMKAIPGLPVLSIPDLTQDKLVISRQADGETYYITPSGLSLAAGNVPAGGLTGQFLAKVSNTDYDTAWESPSILLDPLTIAGNPTGSIDLGVSVGLGATLAFAAGPSIQTGPGTGDVTWTANSYLTTIAPNAVTNTKFRQSAALSVVGNATNALADVADIAAGADHNILRRSGTAIGFGTIDLSQIGAVGTSVLGVPNGGSGAATLTGLLQGHGTSPFTAIADSSNVGEVLQVTGPSTYAWSALSGADVTGAALTANNDTNVTLTLGGTPATALLRAASLTLGWTGQLAVARGGTGAATLTNHGVLLGQGTSPIAATAVGATGSVLSGVTGADPTFQTVSAVLDNIGATQGDVLYRGAASWSALPPGVSGQVLSTGGPAADPSWVTVAGTGTVTSVDQTFTGGLISVSGNPITTSGTLALTVAGTSGGIPYFSSASTWASSAALAASAIMLGGGAGNPPATTTTGTGVVTALGVNTGSPGAFVVNGGALGTPSSGTLTNCTGLPSILVANEAADATCFPAFFTAATGELGPKTNAGLTFDSSTGTLGATLISVGGVPVFAGIPQNSQSAAYTLVLADALKHILHPTADNNPRTFTIPANASVAYPIGTVITFVNQINTLTIAINTDTLTQAGTGSTGSRTLAASGLATALKLSSTSWIISGVGLS